MSKLDWTKADVNWAKHELFDSIIFDGKFRNYIDGLLSAQRQEIIEQIRGMMKTHQNKEQHEFSAGSRGHRQGYQDALGNIIDLLERLETQTDEKKDIKDIILMRIKEKNNL